jgi:hypothetical protein
LVFPSLQGTIATPSEEIITCTRSRSLQVRQAVDPGTVLKNKQWEMREDFLWNRNCSSLLKYLRTSRSKQNELTTIVSYKAALTFLLSASLSKYVKRFSFLGQVEPAAFPALPTRCIERWVCIENWSTFKYKPVTKSF